MARGTCHKHRESPNFDRGVVRNYSMQACEALNCGEFRMYNPERSSTSAGWCSSLVHLFQSLRQLAVDFARLLLLVAKSRSALAAETYFSGSSWPCFKNVKFNHIVQPTRPDGSWSSWASF